MKLVEILARELKEWPEKWMGFTQDADGQIWASTGIDVEYSGGVWTSNGLYTLGCKFDDKALADDHSTAIVTRDQWEAEKMKQENKWIRHWGGKCPVEKGACIDVRYRNGEVNNHVKALTVLNCGGSNNGLTAYSWSHKGAEYDIMAYRLHKQEPKPFNLPESSGALHVTTAPTIPAHMILGYQSKEDMALATGCETMEEVIAKVSSDMDCVYLPGKIDQIDSPILWRDRVREIDTTIESLEEERASLIQRLEDEGLQLLQAKACGSVQPDADMSDWRNWKAGDVVECLECPHGAYYTVGNLYKVHIVDYNETNTRCEVDITSDCGFALWCPSACFKWVSRP